VVLGPARRGPTPVRSCGSFAAAFHLHRAAKLRPDDAALAQRLAAAEAMMVEPSRVPVSPSWSIRMDLPSPDAAADETSDGEAAMP
jgi:hypothetical protein